MNPIRTAISILFRLSGVTLVLLGLFIWSGRGTALAPIHMAIGLAFSLAYFGIIGLASREGLALGPSLLAAAWGFVVPLFGVIQTRILLGPGHWVVRVIHLLFGIVAMAIGNRLLKGNPARATAEMRTQTSP